ncbi:hypothetical protein BSFP_037540 [Burkholderia stabilis]|uniref:Uncharacterized protein n=1 Tax=Burkholderia stabilis TaxID=95485 RepID=A0A1Y1BRD2_9BURK|nr:hypothetical protein BSFP_037540 [Burkholderia stabilis]
MACTVGLVQSQTSAHESTMRLRLVEDDDLIGSGLEISVSQAGHHVDWLRDGHAAAAALATTRFALVVLVVLDLGPTAACLTFR